MSRPSWDDYFMEMARIVATRATCPRKSVGCVIVKGNRILTTGYNGAPSGVPHCTEVNCKLEGNHCVRVVHAEANALAQAARHGIQLEGAKAYVTVQPCVRCSNLLASAGVTVARWDEAYP